MSDPLHELLGIASSLGAQEVVREAASIERRVAEGLFYVACVGQFKRGKSTLINALVDDDILPTGVVPVTAVITIVRYGSSPRAIVRFLDGREQIIDRHSLAGYIAEERNPGNRKSVQVIEVEVPSATLASGMCLVDTPGLGSVFETNSETTRRFLPHVDAALIVLGADPPVSGDEANVAAQIAQQVPDMIFVLNKADRLAESEVAQAVAFCERILRQRLNRAIEIYTISALERIEGKTTRGWSDLDMRLRALARDSGADLVRSAETRGLRRLSGRLLHEVSERRAALLRPMRETEERLASLRGAVEEAKRSLGDLSFLFMSEERNLSVRFGQEREHFLAEVTPAALKELRKAIGKAEVRRGSLRDFAMRAAQRIAEQRIRTWLSEIEPRAEEMYAQAVERFIQLSREFVGRLAGEVAERIDFDPTFRTKRRFFFTDLSALTGRLPGASIFDGVRPHSNFVNKTIRDADRFLHRLLDTNSARVANDLLDRVVESRRRLESEIRNQLENLVGAATRAAEQARETQASGAERVRDQVESLEAIGSRIASIFP